MKKAVVVLSGGLDSTTCMGMAKEKGCELYPITFHYGQRHNREVEQAEKVAAHFGSPEHRIVDVSFLQQIGGSALTDETIEVRQGGVEEDIPSTYVPARNMIFLSLASAYAEVIGAEAIYIGVSAVDYSGYPDCRPEFISSMNDTVNLATKAGATGGQFKIEAPLIQLTKKETIEEGLRLGVPYELTTSCYLGEEVACGECDSCLLRLKGFEEVGAEDPIPYAKRPRE
ncbi:7-cyano-7-deazaguanine synthase QueC [Pseudalkalibacillus salsuginis]|uniref:7-cyano-7-deazaguanine synthase QueC n=1 Tax=Pseudalkalibacillus salsuginis TaxID=2910972 RepID=UPI001F17AF34|nr:7-cyano-7-deazaguanine synthase QueC [Pseudalkalibacillus salsuginis]MCF6408828.1 7-cyano-7-deazaguanine synthase QueC [Pseudalkalibacillus salsuginis]